MILHEDTIWILRLFPKISDILHASDNDFKFFLYQRSYLLMPKSPSSPFLRLDSGTNELCQIFNSGLAVLITPSFFIGSPERAYAFIKWFWKYFSGNSPVYRTGKLVCCAGVADWILHLAIEKSTKSEELTTDGERKLAGLTPAENTFRFKTWQIVRGLVDKTTDELSSPVEFAPDSIDGNDEQSLVNWFGWWTVMNMYLFRKFYVLGSSKQHPARLSRLIQVPTYDMASAQEPWAVAKDQDDVQMRRDRCEALQLVFSDDAESLGNFLDRLQESLRLMTYRSLVFYRYPVAYWDSDMPYYFRDYESAFQSFRNWLKYYAEVYMQNGRNTLIGFYTIEGKWERNQDPLNTEVPRRPWIAIFRATNPHLKPWKSTELLIWDCVAWAKYPTDSDVYLNELIPAQQELVKSARRESPELLHLPLQQVWLGGSIADHEGESFSHPLDSALNWLQNIPSDYRKLIPPHTKTLSQRGWKAVQPGPVPGKRPRRSMTDPQTFEPVGVDSSESWEGVVPKRKMVFHPHIEGQIMRMPCKNRLFEWADAERKRGHCGKSEFTFQPTAECYGAQLLNGQGFHHIKFDSWQAVCGQLKIPESKAVGNQGARAPHDVDRE